MKKKIFRVDLRNVCTLADRVGIRAVSAKEAKEKIQQCIREAPELWEVFGDHTDHGEFYADQVEEVDGDADYEVTADGQVIKIDY